MKEDASRESDKAGAGDRETLELALRTMSVEQLGALRSAIIRLKHLPFTRLTEVLFTEAREAGEQSGTGGRIREDVPNFACDARGHFESEATRDLLEDVENILRARVSGHQDA